MFLKYLAKMDHVLCSIQEFDRSDRVNGKRPWVTAITLWHQISNGWRLLPDRYGEQFRTDKAKIN
jgi:hypothetical protein